MDVLSRADEILLLAILRLKDDASGVSIVKEVQRRTGKDIKLGASGYRSISWPSGA